MLKTKKRLAKNRSKKTRKLNKIKSKLCDSLTFSECELAILRTQVDQVQEMMARRVATSKNIAEIIKITEDFIKDKKLICYGGTAINNILPANDQFYNKDIEIADYDFFTANAVSDAKELADIYNSKGFADVEAKSGQHYGTYKVFVNFIPVADVTELPKELFESLKTDAINVDNVLYAPPDFLRMSMYLELSRPAGDTSRWEKVMNRLALLNKHYPLTPGQCTNATNSKKTLARKMSSMSKSDSTLISEIVRNVFIKQSVVFFGGFAASLYSSYLPKKSQFVAEPFSDFDIISNNPKKTVDQVIFELKSKKIDATITKHAKIGEIIPVHYEIIVGEETVAFVYESIACHSYNIINKWNKKIKVATIDTILSFYLAFLYTNRPYYNQFIPRILCMANFLFSVQQKNRLSQKGLLKRFSITCYGHQPSIEEIRAKKSKKYNELYNKRNSSEYEAWFLNYSPNKTKPKPKPKSKSKTKSKTKTKSKK